MSHSRSAKFHSAPGVAGDTRWGVAGEGTLVVTGIGEAGDEKHGVAGEEM